MRKIKMRNYKCFDNMEAYKMLCDWRVSSVEELVDEYRDYPYLDSLCKFVDETDFFELYPTDMYPCESSTDYEFVLWQIHQVMHDLKRNDFPIEFREKYVATLVARLVAKSCYGSPSSKDVFNILKKYKRHVHKRIPFVISERDVADIDSGDVKFAVRIF